VRYGWFRWAARTGCFVVCRRHTKGGCRMRLTYCVKLWKRWR